MNKRLIFLDIDGTLINAFSAPSARVTDAVRRARANGHKVFLCTGRNMPIIMENILDVGFDGIIASAGSHVEVEGQVLFDYLLPEEVIQECLSAFHTHEIYCRIETPDGIYTDPQMENFLKTAKPDGTNSELIRMQRELEEKLPILPYDRYSEKGAYKICFTGTTPESIEETKKILGDRFTYVVHPFISGAGFVNGEIIPKEVGKGKGMEIICEHFQASLRDTVAFGDSMNDYEMLKTAGVSVAMGNACEELKRMADVVCKSVQEDGIYYEFRKMGFI